MVLAILLVVVLAAVVVDLTDALYTARRLGQPVKSHRLRATVAKLSEYWRLVFAGFLADTVALITPVYTLPFISMVITLGVVWVEIRSLYEHAQKRKSNIVRIPDTLTRLKKILEDPQLQAWLSSNSPSSEM